MLTLPTVFNDALSYDEQVCKLTQAINEMATTINGLPDYIIELVKELLDQMNLEDIVKQVLADYFFINVKTPPAPLKAAMGDGITNDTEAIQGMINYISGKKNYLFFPGGVYSVNQLIMTNGISLIGMNRYSTTINLEANTDKDLLSGDIGNCTISNITLSANMPGQTQNCSIFNGNVTNLTLNNVILKNAYNVLSLNIDGIVQGDNIIVDGMQGNGINIGGDRCVINTVNFKNNSKLNAGTLITVSGDNNTITNISNTEYAENGISVNGNYNVIRGYVNGTTNPIINNGNNIINIGTNGIENSENGGANNNVNGNNTTNVNGNNNITVSGNNNITVSGDGAETFKKNLLQNIGEKGTVISPDYYLNIANHLTYETPTEYAKNLKSVKMKDSSNTVYDVLVGVPGLSYDTYIANVYDYGAVGDGVTDNLLVFNNFIADIIAKGYVGYIPAGNYYISDVINITDSVTLIGDGLKTNLIFLNDGINITTTTQPKGCTLYNFNIAAKNTEKNGLTLTGYWHNISRITFQGLGSMNYIDTYYWTNAIIMDNCWYSVISDCIFLNGPLHTTTTFYFRGCAIRARNQSVNVFITKCTFNNFNLITAFDDTTEGIKFSNNLSVNNKIAINDAGYMNNICDNLIDMNTDYGLVLTGTGTIVSGNFIALHYYAPYKDNINYIPLQCTGEGYTISNNYIQGGESQPINGLIAKGDYININNNYLNAFRTAINLTGNNGVITGNRCRFAATNDVVITGTFNHVHDNQLSNNNMVINGNNNDTQFDYKWIINNFVVAGESNKQFTVTIERYTAVPTMVLFTFTHAHMMAVYNKEQSTNTEIKFTLWPVESNILPTLTDNVIGLLIVR